tara:strand:+ start:1344 stop:1526 length:183 start_codon:yes stop_codon:yes gene_type:complete
MGRIEHRNDAFDCMSLTSASYNIERIGQKICMNTYEVLGSEENQQASWWKRLSTLGAGSY